MTKIHIRSDDHHEFYRGKAGWNPIPADADLVILAGDIDVGTSGLRWASTLGKPVLYIAGNHEYYDRNIHATELALRKEAADFEDVYFLEKNTVVIDDIRFIGTTLWTDYDFFGNSKLSKSYAEYGLADHRLITYGPAGYPKFFSPGMAQTTHTRSKKWLENELYQPFHGKTVVITHHAPHKNSVASIFETDRLTPSFVSDLSSTLEQFNIDVWVHGHMHNPSDYTVYGTRIICNPHGYPGTPEPEGFQPNFMIEL